MEFTKEHKQALSKALTGRNINWADKIAESMVGNQNAKGQDFGERSSGIYKGYKYHAKAIRLSDRTWELHLNFVNLGECVIHGARKVTDKRLEEAYQKARL
jgi:hypothetical protein